MAAGRRPCGGRSSAPRAPRCPVPALASWTCQRGDRPAYPAAGFLPALSRAPRAGRKRSWRGGSAARAGRSRPGEQAGHPVAHLAAQADSGRRVPRKPTGLGPLRRAERAVGERDVGKLHVGPRAVPRCPVRERRVVPDAQSGNAGSRRPRSRGAASGRGLSLSASRGAISGTRPATRRRAVPSRGTRPATRRRAVLRGGPPRPGTRYRGAQRWETRFRGTRCRGSLRRSAGRHPEPRRAGRCPATSRLEGSGPATSCPGVAR